MGVDTAALNAENFDIMRDLENARANLEDRINAKSVDRVDMEDDVLPFEETKLIAWQSDESEDDGFELVVSKKKQRKKSAIKKKQSRCVETQPCDGAKPSEEVVPMTCSRYNLRKHNTTKISVK